MIEIKDISKIQKRERVKDSALGTETTQISNITDEYCKLDYESGWIVDGFRASNKVYWLL